MLKQIKSFTSTFSFVTYNRQDAVIKCSNILLVDESRSRLCSLTLLHGYLGILSSRFLKSILL
jgi:hypothetical protein